MTNLSDREQLKEAVKKVTGMVSVVGYGELDGVREIKVLIEVAKSHLSASEGLPERRDVRFYPQIPKNEINGHPVGRENENDLGFNSCLDQVTPIVARLKEELASKDNLIEGLKLLDVLNKQKIDRMSKSAGVESIIKAIGKHGICQEFGEEEDIESLAQAIHDSIMGEK